MLRPAKRSPRRTLEEASMPTYGDKVRKYEAIVRKGFELGLPPEKAAVEKLLYYVGRAEKHGSISEARAQDKSHLAASEAKKNAKHLLADAHRLGALLAAAKRFL
jgi:hypothetical protein